MLVNDIKWNLCRHVWHLCWLYGVSRTSSGLSVDCSLWELPGLPLAPSPGQVVLWARGRQTVSVPGTGY